MAIENSGETKIKITKYTQTFWETETYYKIIQNH